MRAWLVVMIFAACGGDGGNAGVDAAGNGGGGGSGSGSGSGSGGGSGSGSGSNMGSATSLEYCVSQTNMYRAMNGKPALTESTQLEAYAATGAMYDFTNGPHSHFEATSGGGIAFAENECPVQGNWMLQQGGDMTALVGQCIAAFYAEGPGSDYSTHGHYINMMGPYATLGCGIYQMGTGVTIVQDYGN